MRKGRKWENNFDENEWIIAAVEEGIWTVFKTKNANVLKMEFGDQACRNRIRREKCKIQKAELPRRMRNEKESEERFIEVIIGNRKVKLGKPW